MNLDKLKKVIQEANPEIMELKMGCEIILDGARSPVLCIANTYQRSAFTFIPVIINRNSNGNQEVFRPEIRTIQAILGRPITLADVLMLNLITGGYQYVVGEEGHFLEMRSTTEIGLMTYEGTGIYWNLKETLDNQTDEVLTFLCDLLVK